MATVPTETAVPKTMQANACSLNQLAELGATLSDEWIMEKKLDGFRMVAWYAGGITEGYSRARKAQNIIARLPHIEDALTNILPHDTIVDGEISTADDDFDHVARVMKSLGPRSLELQTKVKPVVYVIFDVLRWDGVDIRHLPLRDRLKFVDTIFMMLDTLWPSHVKAITKSQRYAPSVSTAGYWIANGGEGAMLKNLHEPYVSGKRPVRNWLKYKPQGDADVVVMGFTKAKHGRTGKFDGLIGAIRFGQYKDGQLIERGQTSGMDDALRTAISEDPDSYVGKVMTIKHHGLIHNFRHPQFKCFRDDKLPEECTWDSDN